MEQRIVWFCIALWTSVNCGTVQISRKLAPLTVFINQTSGGYFRRVYGDTEQVNVFTGWFQDDVTKMLRVDVGRREDPGWGGTFYFYNDKGYELGPITGQTGFAQCTMFPDFNYTSEIAAYSEPVVGYVGRHTLHEFGGRQADVYAGPVYDGVGPMNVLMYVDPDIGAYLGLIAIGTYKKFSFVEYWMGDNLAMVRPPAAVFTLPVECKNPKIEYYYQKFPDAAKARRYHESFAPMTMSALVRKK